MKKVLKVILYSILSLVAIILILGLTLAFLPTASKTNHVEITTEEAAVLRKNYAGPHEQFTTTDGETLFLWKWNPDPDSVKRCCCVAFRITAYGGEIPWLGTYIKGRIYHFCR
jgi:hypothetical protein